MTARATVGIVGWHHATPGLFARVQEALAQAGLEGRIHLLNHRPAEAIPGPVLDAAKAAGVVVHHFPNVGFDWGAYSQFLEACKDELLSSDHVALMHDDVEIRDTGILARCVELAHPVIGHHNSLVPGGTEWPRTHPAVLYWCERVYGRAPTLPRWNTVRGSFVFLQGEVLRRVPVIPYRDGPTEGYGNWGVVLWSGLVSQELGVDAIRCLIDQPGPALESRWMAEHLRGAPTSAYPASRLPTSEPAWKPPLRALRNALRRFRDGPPEPPQIEGLKVNVGCGNRPHRSADTLNVDAAGDPDLKIPFDQLDFAPASLAEVMSFHFIEHLTRGEGRAFLRRAHAWLKPGGRFVVECPDVAKIARHILRFRADVHTLEEGTHGLRGLYGEPVEGMTHWDHHKWGYTEDSLMALLRQTGFSRVSCHRPLTHGGLRDRDLRVVGVK